MRKILPALVLGITLAILVAPAIAAAQESEIPEVKCTLRRDITLGSRSGAAPGGDVFAKNSTVSLPGGGGTIQDNRAGMVCALNIFNTVVDWFFLVLIVLAVFFTILGAFNYLTAGGAKEKLESGKNYIMYAAIGLAVAFLARAIPSIVRALLV